MAELSTAHAQKRELECVVSTAIIYVRESDRDTTGFVVREDVELYVSDCESDGLCIVHWPIYGQQQPAFVDSRDLRQCSDGRYSSRSFTKRSFTPVQYRNYTRPTVRRDR